MISGSGAFSKTRTHITTIDIFWIIQARSRTYFLLCTRYPTTSHSFLGILHNSLDGTAFPTTNYLTSDIFLTYLLGLYIDDGMALN